MHYPFRQEIERQKTGSISSVLAQNIIKDVTNDGGHYTNWKEIEPESQMPSAHNQEIIIRLTDANLDITQLNETFLSLNVKATLNFSQIPFQAITGTNARLSEDLQRGFFLFVGLKNGSDIIKDYTIFHKNIAVTDTLQNDATVESALYHIVEDKDSKNNKKHVHSLYDSVHEMDTSCCGIYLSYYDLKSINASTNTLTVNIPVNIPITDILAFQAFTEYPNSIFGDLKIKFRINPGAFVFAMVDPHASAKKHFYTTDYEGVHADNVETVDEFIQSIPTNPAYDRGFFQFGTSANLSRILYEVSDGETIPTYTIEWNQATQNVMISMPTYTVDRCTCIIRGFNMNKAALANEKQKYMSEPFVVPAQRIDISAFSGITSATELKTSQNIALRRVTDFMVYFPKYAQQITCWENPMLTNLHLNTMGRNYPEKAVSTIDPNFIQMQLQAADLSSFNLEATDEYENSLTIPRATSTIRLTPHTDLTSFVFIVPVERASGAGIYFDGLDSNGQNVSVELRGAPIYQGANDTYYNHTGDGSTRPQFPVLAMVMDTYWIFSSVDNGHCHYETRRDIHEILGHYRDADFAR